MLCILLIEYLVFSPWSSNGVLGWGFFSKVRISCVTCVSLSSDDVLACLHVREIIQLC